MCALARCYWNDLTLMYLSVVVHVVPAYVVSFQHLALTVDAFALYFAAYSKFMQTHSFTS